MRHLVRKLSVLGGFLLLLAISSFVAAKSPEERALKDYGAALQELGNILQRVKDVPSAQAAVPQINQQIDKIKALHPELVTQKEGDPKEKPKSKEDEKKSADVKKLSEQLQQSATRLSQEMERVLADPEIAKIVQPALGRMSEQ